MEVEFVVHGEPKGKQRPRVARGHAYTPSQTREYEKLVALEYQSQVGKELAGMIEVDIVATFSIPKSTTKKNRSLMLSGKILHTKRCDCDNIAKIILDGLNGIAYQDDKQVCKLSVLKKYGAEPKVAVALKEL